MKRKFAGLGILLLATSLVSAYAAAAQPDLAEHYLAIQKALAADSLEMVGAHATAIKETLNSPDFKDMTADLEGTEPRAQAAAAAAKLAKAGDLKAARLAFGELSEILIDSGALNPAGGLKVAYCPMAKKHWLQTGDKITNPYFGSKMLHCGKFVPQSAPKH